MMVESAAQLLSACVITTVTSYATDQFAATAPAGQLERFYDKAEAVARAPPPAWHRASLAEVR